MGKIRYHTVKEVLKLMDCSRGTLYNWEKAKKIPKPKRDKMSRFRIYTKDDIKKLKKITGRE